MSNQSDSAELHKQFEFIAINKIRFRIEELIMNNCKIAAYIQGVYYC